MEIFTGNLTKEERAIIKELRENEKIILKKSDKGGRWLIMDKEYYISHIVLNSHFCNPIYKPIPSNTDQKVFENLLKLVDKYSSNLVEKEKEYVLNNTWKTSEFCCIIKTHKCKSIQEVILQNDNDIIINFSKPNYLKSRPIVAGPTQVLRSLFKILKPIVLCLTTYKRRLVFYKTTPKNLKL